jgi:signal transduction histidine kinase/ligand-binding sensor domain-containing protein
MVDAARRALAPSARLLAWACLLLCLGGAALAAPGGPVIAAADRMTWSPTIDRLTSAEGLPSHSLYSVTRDAQGFLWFGSDNGAIRYDGRRMLVLRAEGDADPDADADTGSNAGTRPRISSNSASHVFVDRHGSTWLGTWGAGLDRIDLARGRVDNWRFAADDPDSMASDLVQALFEDRAGTLWIGTGAGLMRFDRDADRPRRALTRDEGAEALGPLRIWSIAEALDGTLWLGTSSGLFQFDPRSGTAEHHPQATERSSGDLVRLVMVDHRGRLWVAPDNGFGRYEPDRQRLVPTPVPTGLAGGLILNTALDAGNGHFWLGSWSGVWLLDADAGRLVEIGASGLKQWFPADDVRGLYFDPTGLLWVATRYNGAARLLLDAPRVRSYRQELADLGGGMGSDVVRSIYRGAGHVWLNTDGGMVRVDLDRARFDPLDATRGLRAGRFGPSAFDDAGGVLIATVFGAARLDLRSQEVMPFGGLLEQAGVRDPNLGFVVRVAGDRLWWSTQREGMVVSDLAGGLLQHHPPGPGPGRMAEGSATCLHEDRRGRVWLCGATGLSRWNVDSGDFDVFRHEPGVPGTLSHSRVNTVLEDSSGTLWFGTAAGIDRWDEASGRFEHYRPQDRPLSVVSMLEAGPGELWLAAGRQLWNFDVQDRRFEDAPLQAGERGQMFTENAALRLDDRRLLFGTTRGLLLFDPLRTELPDVGPAVAITEVRVDGGLATVGMGPDGIDEIEVPPYAQSVVFEFAALDFRAPLQNRHAYRLEGFDRDWSEVTAQTAAKYTNLAPGDYLFRVRAAGPDLVWSDEGAQLRLIVLPPWWLDWRLHVLALLLLVLVIVVASRGYAARVRRNEHALERMVEERTQIIARQQQQLAVQEKMASLGTLTSGVAHEINNPTNFTHVGAQNLQAALVEFEQLLLQLAGDDVDREVLQLFETRFAGMREQLGAICEGTDRIRTIVGHLRSFARLDDAELTTLQVDAGLRSTLTLVRTQFSDAIRFDTDLDSHSLIEGWPAQLNQVYMNLIVNACQAAIARHGRDPGAALVLLRSRDTADGVMIDVLDNGGGIRPEHRSRIFEPFFTTKDIGEGTGMGLAIAYGIVERHGGRLEVVSTSEKGTCMRLYLPSRSPAATA